MGTLPFSLLFAAHRSASSLVALFAGIADPHLAAGFSGHVLLLPQGLLSRFFSRSSGVRCWREQRAQLQGRNGISVRIAKSSSLFSLCRDPLSCISLARRDPCLLF